MLIKSDFEVAEPVEKVWQFFEDIPQVATCLPGAELTEDLGGEKYKGRVAVRMGPVRLQFAGTADITERDETAKRVVVHAAGAEEKGRGQASMTVTATLARAGRGTRVDVTQDLQLSGAAAQYGRGNKARPFQCPHQSLHQSRFRRPLFHRSRPKHPQSTPRTSTARRTRSRLSLPLGRPSASSSCVLALATA